MFTMVVNRIFPPGFLKPVPSGDAIIDPGNQTWTIVSRSPSSPCVVFLLFVAMMLLLTSGCRRPGQTGSSHTLVLTDTIVAGPMSLPSKLPSFNADSGTMIALIPLDNASDVRLIDDRLVLESSAPSRGVAGATFFRADHCEGIQLELTASGSTRNPVKPAHGVTRRSASGTDMSHDIKCTVTLGWKRDTDNDYPEYQQQTRNFILPEGKAQTLRVVVYDSPLWSGTITGLRLAVSPGVRLILSSIEGYGLSFDTQTSLWRSRWRTRSESRPAKAIWSGQEWLAAPLHVPAWADRLEFGWMPFQQGSTRGSEVGLEVEISSPFSTQRIATGLIPVQTGEQQGNTWHTVSIDLQEARGRSIDVTIRGLIRRKEKPLTPVTGPVAVFSQPVCIPARDDGAEDTLFVMVSLDTLRSDHLGCYGYPVSTSPFLDYLAKKSATIIQAITPYPSTAPAHASLFTGRFPFQHGVIKGDRQLPLGIDTMAEHLFNQGFMTYAVTGGGNVSAYHRMDQGFLAYDEGERGITSLRNRLLPLMERHVSGKRFIFYHTYEIHAPFPPHPPLTDYYFPDYRGEITGFEFVNKAAVIDLRGDDLSYMVALYDSGIRITDHELQSLYRFMMRDRGTNDMLVICADHGEHFGEHGLYGHGNSLFTANLDIPLIINAPAQIEAGTLVSQTFNLVDLPATLFAMQNLKPALVNPGRDLSEHLVSPKRENRSMTFSELRTRHGDRSRWVDAFSMTDQSSKLILTLPEGNMAFYKLPSLETENDRIDMNDNPDAMAMEAALMHLLDERSLPAGDEQIGASPLDEKTLRLLQALGYLEGIDH